MKTWQDIVDANKLEPWQCWNEDETGSVFGHSLTEFDVNTLLNQMIYNIV